MVLVNVLPLEPLLLRGVLNTAIITFDIKLFVMTFTCFPS